MSPFMRRTYIITFHLMNSAPWSKFTTITFLWLKDEGNFVSLVHHSGAFLALPQPPVNQPLLFPGWAGEIEGPPAEF